MGFNSGFKGLIMNCNEGGIRRQ